MTNCSCVAYAYPAGISCMVWVAAGLMDIQQSSSVGEDLFIRLAYSELGREKINEELIISSATISIFSMLVVGTLLLCKWKANQRIRRRKGFDQTDAARTSRAILRDHVIQEEPLDLPTIDYDKVVIATNNFNVKNKLGEGGFGPVYKGKLEDGQEIAVKRLSSHSGQGVDEFKNEIILISKLQHRNLVKLLGRCIEREEMLLIYEYMKNKSLDNFLFDPVKSEQLDWIKRFNIIQGIARGLLYLHRDSCLRIIHRDLKASNILLDDDLNPKISDFGLARTFQLAQELANTQRVVGTL